MLKLLIITPTLGQSPFLEETVASVAAVRPRPRHVLVCPATSAAALAGRFPEITIIASEAKGVYAAIEAGLRVDETWDAWTWLNDDDRLLPDATSRAWARMERDPANDIVYGRVAYCDCDGARLGPLPVESQPSRLRGVFRTGIPAMTQQGTLMRRALAERLGGFNPRYRLAGDFDYWARAIATGAGFAFHPEIVAEYRLHGGQLSADTQAVAREIAASAREVFPGARGLAMRRERILFRLRHLPDLVRRWRACGCLRTSTMYRRAARAEVAR